MSSMFHHLITFIRRPGHERQLAREREPGNERQGAEWAIWISQLLLTLISFANTSISRKTTVKNLSTQLYLSKIRVKFAKILGYLLIVEYFVGGRWNCKYRSAYCGEDRFRFRLR